MASFFQQVFSLLTTEPGSLTYHLVLTFSIVGALQAALAVGRSGGHPAARRMAIGLGLMLLVRMVLFVAAGLIWQGLINGSLLLPLLDRAADLLGLVLMVWLWAFPLPSRPGDAAALLVGLLTLTLIALGMVWYLEQASGSPFNGSWPDLLAEISSLLLLAVGALLLLTRRPEGWGLGLAAFLVLALGHAAHLLYPLAESDYAGAVRLAQLAAYPLLLLLPQRFPPVITPPALAPEWSGALAQALLRASEPGEAAPDTATASLPPEVFRPFLILASESGTADLCQAMTAVMAQFMQADLCWMLSTPESGSGLSILCGYDQAHRRYLPSAVLPGEQIPQVVDAVLDRQPLRLNQSAELAALATALHLPQAGSLLIAPFASSDGRIQRSFALLTPYSKREWSAEDEGHLYAFCAALRPVLDRMRREQVLESDLAHMENSLEASQQATEAALVHGGQLEEELRSLRQRSQNERSQLDSLSAMVAAQETAQDTVARLKVEIENLKNAAQLASELHPVEEQSDEIERMEGELRLALQEVARLRNALTEADEKLLTMQRQMEAATPQPASLLHQTEALEEITTIIQELRQPMASIVGYTDVLLGESVGILGTLQHKFLERVKTAAERAAHMLDDLARMTSAEFDVIEADSDQTDLKAALQTAADGIQDLVREKMLDFQVQTSDPLPALNADPDAIQQILVRLLRNAAIVTPPEGQICLKAHLESLEGQPDWVLVQVVDAGGGIPSDDLGRVFNRFARPEYTPIPGIGESASELAIARALVDSLGGRIWVDTQENLGSTFSLLLPVHPVGDGLNGTEGEAA